MAPVISKLYTFKNGKKVPINATNVKAVVNLTKKLSTKRIGNTIPIMHDIMRCSIVGTNLASKVGIYL